jgi:hypothetical protein
VLATREYFAERWHKNIIRFCLSVNKIASFRAGSFPVVIAAAGPSLEPVIPRLHKPRGNFFLIAVSSALEPLASRGVLPDLCVTADGGFWAKELLPGAAKTDSACAAVIACSAESAIPARLFETRAMLPLSYNEGGAENLILKSLNIPALVVRRNGTVSGIALDIARAVSSGQVFFCGLDLAVSTGYQHAQPHARELRERAFDTRVYPLASRQTASGINTRGALAVYRNWFLSHSGADIFRVAREPRETIETRERESAGMHDISPDEFSRRLDSHPRTAAVCLCEKPESLSENRTDRARKLRSFINDDISRVKNGEPPRVFSFDEAFPARMVNLRRNRKSTAYNAELSDSFFELMEKLLALTDSLCRYCTK